MEGVISKFKAGAATVEALCRGVADGLLVDVERKRVYDVPEFEEVQAAHHARVRAAGVATQLGQVVGWDSMLCGFSRDTRTCNMSVAVPHAPPWPQQ
jgi:hypothetical protein